MNAEIIRDALAGAGRPLASMVETLYAVGYWLHANERYADAAGAFRVLLQAAPTEERSWLAVGECHEKAGQLRIALELYGSGTVAASPAPRCMLARARVLRALDRDGDADEAFDQAEALANDVGDDELARLIDQERRAS
jgi:hypothetical protein